MPVAINAEGKAVRTDDSGAWVPTKTAKNPQTGETLVFDGKGWITAQSGQGGNTAKSLTSALGSGINQGLISMVGAPVDLATAGLNLIPGINIQNPPGGSQSIRGITPDTLLDPGRDTTAGRVVNRIGQEVGAAALPAGAVLRAARGVPAALTAGKTLAQNVKSGILDPIRRTPAKAALGELAAATGAGAGASVAQELAPGSQGAELTGQLLGGITPAILAQMPASVAIRVVNGLTRRFSKEAAQREGRRVVEDTLGAELTTEAERLLKEADALREAIPGFNPSVPEATGSPALVATQKQIERTASGGDLENLAARRISSEQAVESFAQSSSPDAAGGADFVIDTASGRVQALREAVGAEQAKASVDRQGLGATLPRVDKPAAGETIRTGILKVREQVRVRMNRLADRLGINNEDVTVPFDAWRKSVLDEVRPESEFGDTIGLDAVERAVSRRRAKAATPPDSSILDEFGDPFVREGLPETTTFQDVKAVRERISDALIDEVSSGSPSRKKIRALTSAKRSMDGFLGELADSDISGRYREFRTAYFNEYITPFENGTVFKVRQKSPGGSYRTADEKVAEAFWRAGDIAAARQFKAVLGADAAANEALEAVALDSLRDATLRDGVIQPKALETWTRRHASLLDEFPSIKAKAETLESANLSLIDRQGALAGRQQLIEDQILTKELNAFSKTTKTGAQVIDAAIKDPRKMAQLVSTLRANLAALDSLRRHVWDQALGGDILGFMAANRRSLAGLFTPNHMENLSKVARARAMHDNVPPPAGKGFIPRPFEDVERAIGQGIPQIGSRIFAFKSGRMQKGYLVLDTLMRGLRGRAQTSAEDIFRVALYDPQIARDMAQAINLGRLPDATGKRLGARYFALAPTLMQDQEVPDNGGN